MLKWAYPPLMMKVTHLQCNILVKSTTEGVEIFSVQWANPLEINTPL